jgi:hypothetical protein
MLELLTLIARSLWKCVTSVSALRTFELLFFQLDLLKPILTHIILREFSPCSQPPKTPHYFELPKKHDGTDNDDAILRLM